MKDIKISEETLRLLKELKGKGITYDRFIYDLLVQHISTKNKEQVGEYERESM